MILKTSIFSIPIYICSSSEFSKTIQKKKLQFEIIQKNSFAFKIFGIVQQPKYTKDEWKYNKIIGWIEIFLNGKTLKADYWFISSKKIRLDIRNKQFEYIYI